MVNAARWKADPHLAGSIVNAKNSFRIIRETRFLKKAGFPDLSGKNCYHIQRFH
jgi:hypothetical protein